MANFTIKNKYEKLVLRLRTYTTIPLRLYYRVNGTGHLVYGVENDGIVTFTITFEDYNKGDVLHAFKIVALSTAKDYYIGNFHEGVTFFLDGEEVANVHTTGNNNPKWTHKFNETGEHTIEAIYRGNTDYATATTFPKVFFVGEDSDTPVSSAYAIKYIDDVNDKFKYKDGTQLTVKLTRGGLPVEGGQIQTVSTGGYTHNTFTRADGTATVLLGDLGVGGHTLTTMMMDGNDVNCSCRKDIIIEKNDPLITGYDSAVSKGGELVIRYQEPDGKSLNDQWFTVYINGKAYTYLANRNGRIWVKFSHSGTFRCKAVYGGTENMNSYSVEFTKTIT